ncbi:hypothetical protein [Sphingomicrobium astaxanthinifaciens]|uniref:hypothetical protein n=1 Tax=Sphingomicrobium astaxanthinifaciens TaxID=1227949 RepID=UPI001FCCA760|nr:hypothetical protein [Sphingomicrobium astaxanthinifaciens]MCJ7420286.1 hypothetical protein [Sphingomicrobium astaxanthinifaciens]
MAEQDRFYFAQRAAEEMERAQDAANPAVVDVHRQMTRRYLERALVGDRPGYDVDEDALVGEISSSR